jgi:MOSC domain-containing protein YiiM
MTTATGDLPRDLGIWVILQKLNQAGAGVYASVYHGGTIHRGDHIRIEE